MDLFPKIFTELLLFTIGKIIMHFIYSMYFHDPTSRISFSHRDLRLCWESSVVSKLKFKSLCLTVQS